MLDLELHEYNDGTLRLYYQDSTHGQDRTFVLSETGEAWEATYVDDETETLAPVNLAQVLRAMVKAQQAKNEAYYAEMRKGRQL